jgi:Ca-activated chloride channel family protein
VPTADVVEAVQSSWENLRRKVDVMLILDRSGSMNDNGKIEAAKQGLLEFVGLLGNLDGLGLTTFSDNINVQSPVQPLGPNRQKIINQLNTIDASGNTRLYDTIDEQVKALSAVQTKHMKVVVVLTDGMDDASNISKTQLIDDIKTSGTDAGDGIKVFTIAYGSDADFSDLTQIASATGGQGYTGSPQNIRQVYYDISQFF